MTNGAVLVGLVAVLARAPVPLPASAPGAYVALGGSNTCGHGVPPHATFQYLLASELRRRQLISRHDDRCVPAAGPAFAATCISHFIPRETAFATIEYLPNMYSNSADRNLVHFGALAQMLAHAGALAVVVQVMEGVPGGSGGPPHVYAYPRKTIENVHARMAERARSLRFRTLLVDGAANESAPLFMADRRHLNEAGHRHVARRALELLDELAAARAHGSGAPRDAVAAESALAAAESARARTRCMLGEALAPAVLDALKFNRSVLGEGKVGWEATEPGAALTLCASRQPLRERTEVRLGLGHGHSALQLGLVRIFFSRGCGLASPRLVGKRPPSHNGECAPSSCSYDPRPARNIRSRALQVDFVGYILRPTAPPGAAVRAEPSVSAAVERAHEVAARARCSCAVSVTNSPLATPRVPGHRVIVRALVIAPAVERAYLWANEWHFSQRVVPAGLGVRLRLRRVRRRLLRLRSVGSGGQRRPPPTTTRDGI
ncbi:hypothetical protein KFE25_005566 [Diacronema lutheri]|uniref:SGNH hydrolase-type esterase domain-containing protein n=1 Tax=Diacronema lutheri TaxID=2081491 RepID=A0A8J6CCD9_DIALT|nr:hypothetical protein KFE25_005566 [Diacronema lutheri]